MKKVIREADPIPKGYGIAYVNVNTLSITLYPIPLNVIIAALRNMWLWLVYGHKLYETAYEKGYFEGKEKGREFVFHQYKSQAIRQELETIVSNFLGARDKALEFIRNGEEEKASGWIHSFIDKETERIRETH